LPINIAGGHFVSVKQFRPAWLGSLVGLVTVRKPPVIAAGR
jgi:hypothetical protein